MPLCLTLDTNTIVSALLWRGNPRKLLDAVRAGVVDSATSPMLLAELADVLGRTKFAAKVQVSGETAEQMINDYARVARVVFPLAAPRVVPDDPDDDHVIACAVAARVDLIVSGDSDLLVMGEYAGIRIVTVAQALALLIPAA